MGTAPFRPDHNTKIRSPGQPHGQKERPDQQRAHDEREQDGEDQPDEPRPGADDLAQGDGEAEDHERDDLGEAGQRRVEALDLPLERRRGVSDEDPGDEHGQEPRSLRHGGEPVETDRDRERAQRVEALAGQRDPADGLQQHPAARRTDGGTDRHLQGERPQHVADGARVDVASDGEQAEQQRDTDRIVRPRLALDDHTGPASDLPVAQYGEHDGRVGRRQRGAQQQGQRPRDAEQHVGQQRDGSGGEQGADDADDQHGRESHAQLAGADAHTAVEEDEDQRHRDDLFHRPDR